MNKLLPIALVATALVWGQTSDSRWAIAGTCASNCGPQPIQFTPGKRVEVKLVNRTGSLVLLERVQGTEPIPLSPGQVLLYDTWGGTKPNISVVFWEQGSLPLKVNLSQPNTNTLQIEFRPNWRPPGDRSVYIRNDGRVQVF